MVPETFSGKKYLPALIGAGLCLFLLRTGFFSFFFLVPLGFVAFRHDFKIAWAATFFAVSGNLVLTLGMARGMPAVIIAWNLVHFTSTAFIFTWILAPPPSGILAMLPLSSSRLIAGSCLASLVFIGMFLRVLASPSFEGYAVYFLNTLNSIFGSSGAENANMEMLTAEAVMQGIKFLMLRGGSLFSCIILFIVSRQLSYLTAAFGRGRVSANEGNSAPVNSLKLGALLHFRVNPIMIWVFSSSLLLAVIARALKLEIPEIVLWNIIVLCVILYFAQGLGIVAFFLSRPSISSFMRIGLLILLGILFFSPILNMLLLSGLVLLGIAENWVPFRAKIQNGPPSTPEAGNGET